MDDAAKIKEAVDCRDWVEASLGPPAQENGEWSKWPCPFHDEREPSFTVYVDHYYCYGCRADGDVFKWVMQDQRVEFKQALETVSGGTVTSGSLRAQAQRHRKIAGHKKRRIQVLSSEVRWHEEYAQALLKHAEALDYIESRGVPQAVAMYYGLGYRSGAPWGPSISIPWKVGNELRGIQYRVIRGNGNMRYRWDERGHGNPTIFNADAIGEGKKPIWITEGALKSLVLITHGLESVALVNKQGWKPGWAGHFRERLVYVALDPDAAEEAGLVASDIGRNAKVVQLPRKPDDLIVQWGWTADHLVSYARMGMRYA